MHNAALAAVGLDDWRYQFLPAPPELFAEIVGALPAAGFAGANVTIPHKSAALALATAATPRARAIGAANTLRFGAGGEIHADNTDAPALIAALPQSPGGRTAVVLGAGGSARAAVWALIDAGAARVEIWNRTPERAGALAAELGAGVIEQPRGADVLVNCTAVGLDGSDPFDRLPVTATDLGDYGCVVDFVYTAGDTALTRAARDQGIPNVDGMTLLIGQGALSFSAFTGRPAPLEVMREAAVRA